MGFANKIFCGEIAWVTRPFDVSVEKEFILPFLSDSRKVVELKTAPEDGVAELDELAAGLRSGVADSVVLWRQPDIAQAVAFLSGWIRPGQRLVAYFPYFRFVVGRCPSFRMFTARKIRGWMTSFNTVQTIPVRGKFEILADLMPPICAWALRIPARFVDSVFDIGTRNLGYYVFAEK